MIVSPDITGHLRGVVQRSLDSLLHHAPESSGGFLYTLGVCLYFLTITHVWQNEIRSLRLG